MRERLHRLFPLMMMLVFVGYFVSTCAFTHTHLVDGVRIVHSHPHAHDHEQKGHTSASELILFELLSDYSHALAPSVLVIDFHLDEDFPEVHTPYYCTLQSVQTAFPIPRGPPCL